MLTGDNNGIAPLGDKGRPVILNHQEMETYLGRYCGLMLYLKEMDEKIYAKICAVSLSLTCTRCVLNGGQAYFTAASELHLKQSKALLTAYGVLIKRPTDEETEQGTSRLSRLFFRIQQSR